MSKESKKTPQNPAASSTVSVDDYVIDVTAAKAAGPLSGSVSYEVVLQTGTDFIIARHTSKNTRELVVLVSKGLFYIKDKRTGGVEDITLSRLKAFLWDLKEGTIALESVKWLPALSRDASDKVYKNISDADLADMCRHNLLTDVWNPEWFKPFWAQNSKLFLELAGRFPIVQGGQPNNYQRCLPLIFALEARYGFDEALHFAERLSQSAATIHEPSVRRHYDNYVSTDCLGFTQLLDAPYNLELRRLEDYIFFDLYAQGYDSIGCVMWEEYAYYVFVNPKIRQEI